MFLTKVEPIDAFIIGSCILVIIAAITFLFIAIAKASLKESNINRAIKRRNKIDKWQKDYFNKRK